VDRRRHPRLKIEIDVDLESEHNFYSTHTRDISEGGLFVQTEMTVPVGARVDVRLNLDGRAIEAEAEVAWQLADASGRNTGLGLRFCNLPEAGAEAVRWFMLQRDPMIFGEAVVAEERPIPRPPPLPKR
jgi:uncharacterized protein (TIGR02266 family)